MRFFTEKKTYRQSFLLFSVFSVLLFVPKDFAYANIILDYIAGAFYQLCLLLGGIFVIFGGYLLDGSFKMLVIGMGDRFAGDVGLGVAVTQLWTTVRDLINMLFIFALVYIGIRTILNSEDSSTRKSLGLLIAAALLINFSLLITQTIVDFSNILAVQIYNQSLYTQVSVAEDGEVSSNVVKAEDTDPFYLPGRNTISGAFIHSARLTSFAGLGGIENSGANTFVLALVMFIFFVFTGMIMAFGGILIIGRFVALVIYMVLSPIMFLGWILPNFSEMSSKWRKGFFKQCFFAPAYMFLLFMSLRVMQTLMATIREGASYADLTNVNADSVSSMEIIVYFCMMIGFMYASIKVAQMMSIAGASGMSGGIESMGRGLRGLGGTARGFAYRNTAGRALNKLGVGMFNRLDNAAENTDDNRWKSRSAARVTRGLLGGEAGRRAVVKARDYGAGGTGFSDAQKMDEERTGRATRAVEVDKINTAISQGATAAPGSSERVAMERAVAKASSPQILEMSKSEGGRSALLSAVGDLNTDHIKALSTSETLSDEFKKQLGEKKQEATHQQLGIVAQGTAGPGHIPAKPENLSKATKDQIKSVGYEKLYDHAEYLQDSQLDDLKSMAESGIITPTELAQIKQERETKINAAATGSLVETQRIINSRKSEKEIAKLPKDFLESTNFINASNLATSKFPLTASILKRIADESDGVDKRRIGVNIRTTYGAGVPGDINQFLSSGMGAMFS